MLYQKKYLFSLVLCFLLFLTQLSAENIYLQFSGYVGTDQIEKAEQAVQDAAKRSVSEVVIEINSSSGDLTALLKFVKQIYALKAEKGTKVIVYIHDNAVGPVAMIPFLADELYISFFVSWGDIPLGTESILPTNILRNNVRSLIDSTHPQGELLNLMASAMTDPSLQVIDDNGWKASKKESRRVISSPGETLVVNHNQLENLGLISEILAPRIFRHRYQVVTRTPSEIAPSDQVKVISRNNASTISFLQKHIQFNPDGPNTIGIINIDDKKSQISQATWIYVKNALDYYKKLKPAFVILELNTPGGEVFSSQKISDALKELDTQYDIPVVAFINNWAISAGAMLAYSCRFITVTKDASMGAAEPVFAGEGGQYVAAPEKVNSALRADFANRAGFFDRNADIAEAMVDKDVILVKRHGKVIKLDNEEDIRKGGTEPDILISSKGKLLTLNADDMMDLGVANLLLLPTRTEFITEEERDQGKWPASKMLLFKQDFFKDIPNATVVQYKMDWKTKFLALISNPFVSSMLFLGMMLGFYVEINSPGFGFPGSVALLCLVMIALSSFALEVVNVLEMILLLVGLVFIALDLFLIPTFGILGIVGVIFFFIGLFGMMLPGIGSVEFEFDTQTFNAAGEVFIRRLAWLCGSLVAGVISIALLGKYVMPSFKGFHRFVLEGHEETAENGYIAGAHPKTLPQPGARGEVLATLRPAGKVMIQDEIHEAVSAGEFIEQGTPIEVQKLDGSVIVVTEVKDEEQS